MKQRANEGKESAHDIRCATSGTRAAITAFVFGALAIALLQPLDKARSSEALAKYIELRLQMKESADLLEQDSCWKDLLANSGQEQTYAKDVADFRDYQCPRGGRVVLKWEPGTERSACGAPPPPKNFRIERHLTQLNEIFDSIIEVLRIDASPLQGYFPHKVKRLNGDFSDGIRHWVSI